MYKILLILKYLRKRRIAWVSLVAVALCTMLVLVVISVMGGWLRMFRLSFHGLSGDIVIQGRSMSGFAYYDEIIPRLEALPGVGKGGAVPVIKTFGLINIGNRKTEGVQVLGYQIDKIGNVNSFQSSLYAQYQEPMEREAAKRHEKELSPAEEQAFARTLPAPSFALRDEAFYRSGGTMESGYIGPKSKISNFTGMIAGIGVIEIRKDETGKFVGRHDDLYRYPVKLTVLGVAPQAGSIDLSSKAERSFFIVDDSRTKVYQQDSNTVYVPFDVVQRDLGMDAHKATEDGVDITVPARTNEIDIKVQPGFNLDAVKAQVQAIAYTVIQSHRDYDPNAFLQGPPVWVATWEESQATWLGAIEKEKLLVTFLFSLISIVAVFLIFCIFYMIVVEKTRDIGIIKSVGATSAGVGEIFLGYGLTIGVMGAGLGLLLGWLIVHNINFLHMMMGKRFHVQIWNPEVYAFETIPNTMDPKEVTVILIVAVLSAVLGALIPAWVAGSMHPVEALRWE